MREEKPYKIPEEILEVSDKLKEAGFESYLVGGCVRDIFLGQTPKDWDLATEAKPEEIIPLFKHTYYENEFGTVGIVNDEAHDPALSNIEVTTYRKEGPYKDKRRPDTVTYSEKIEEDLSRRDFTINAMALSIPKGKKNISEGQLIDIYNGKKDLIDGKIRAVGNPEDRFNEDGLRIMRAVRLASELGFQIEKKTERAILDNGDVLKEIAKERIRDEFVKIVRSDNPAIGLALFKKLGIMKYIIPEFEETFGVEQGGIHKYDVFEHSVRALQHAAQKNYSLEVRLASLLHDIGKPRTRRKRESGKKEYSFYGHEVIGARMSEKILERLKFPRDTIEEVKKLVRWHMFFMDTDEITLSAIRRMIRNVGQEDIWKLMELRTADRIGAGRPKEKPYRLRKYQSMIEEALRDPVSVSQLKVDGNEIMKEINTKPGPKIGWILHALLEEVLDDPSKNNKKYLLERARELDSLPENEIKKMGEKGEKTRQKEEQKELKKLRKKYGVE